MAKKNRISEARFSKQSYLKTWQLQHGKSVRPHEVLLVETQNIITKRKPIQ